MTLHVDQLRHGGKPLHQILLSLAQEVPVVLNATAENDNRAVREPPAAMLCQLPGVLGQSVIVS